LRYKLFFNIIIVFLLSASFGYAQTNPLDSTYSISAENKSIYSILQELSNKSGLYFTYNSDILYEDSTVSINFEEKELRIILEDLFPANIYSFDLVQSHIIISEKIQKDEDEAINIEPFIFIKGVVSDKLTRRPLQFSSVSVFNKEIGTISNTDGSFVLKVPWEYRNDSIAFSFMGYITKFIPVLDFTDKRKIVFLQQQYIPIQEIIIRNAQPLTLLRKSYDKKTANYSTSPVILNSFYREAVKKGNNYVLYSEALIDIYKSAYSNNLSNDQVRLKKSRKVVDYVNLDTVLLKLKAGVNSTLLLDFIKNPISFYTPEHYVKYHYQIIDITNFNKKLAYVLEFEQFGFVTDPYYQGKIYIDVSSYAVLGAEFEINKTKINKAAHLFVVKKTRNIDVRPVYAKYRVEYREYKGIHYLSYARGDLKLRVKNKQKFFANTFETFIELAVSEVDTTNTKRFRNKDLLRTRDVFVDNISEYDTEFWEDFNFVPPEESIEEAIKRIKEAYPDQ
jgi:CarboxypepD_reg-like domain